MPRDNQDTNPFVILARNKSRGNAARLNMELAIAESEQINTGAAASSATASTPSVISSHEVQTGTGGTTGGRWKVSPDILD
jgi:hypothetical protein